MNPGLIGRLIASTSSFHFSSPFSPPPQMSSDGSSPAEFTPVGEWVREHSVFNMMKQLPPPSPPPPSDVL